MGYWNNQSEGWERISAPPGHGISQGLAPGARVVTCRGGGGNSLCRAPPPHKKLLGAGVPKF